MTHLLLQVAACLLLVAAIGGLLLNGHNVRSDRLAARCRAVQNRRTRSIAQTRRRSGPKLRTLIGAFGSNVIRTGLLSPRTLQTLRATLASAGLRPDSAMGLFVGCKLLLLLGMPLLAWFAAVQTGLDGSYRIMALIPSAVAGMLLPDMLIKRMRKRHVARVERGLPDALDLLIICTEAGMAIEPALQRVGQELVFAHPETARELATTSGEMQLSGDPGRALAAMGTRTSLEAVRRLGMTVMQTLEYGTPLGNALRLLAAELRTEMITRFEEKAARLPVLLTLPMIALILPTLFLVIGGPAAVQIIELMKQ